MTVETKEVVTVVAYMIGLKKDLLNEYYGSECGDLVARLEQSRDATIIRYLNKIKTSLMKNFSAVDNEIRYNLNNIDRMPQWFDVDNIKWLAGQGFNIVKANWRAEKYMEDVTALINKNIDACQPLFYDWVKFEYIRELFYVAKYQKKDYLKSEFNKYMKNMGLYPFQMYIHWNPSDHGNLLYNDKKFLTILYAMHKDYLEDESKTHDAGEEVKGSIYDFIDNGKKIVIAVDCENSDAFKLYGVLKNLNQDEIRQIEKIILYDDIHTSDAWKWIGKFTKIPIEHIEVERITGYKSLVDIKMTAGICTEFYKNGTDSFIMCSSDSDFWGLISSIPDARFLVMYEYAKCGDAVKQAFAEHGIYHCAMDDFYTGNANDLKKAVLLGKLDEYLPDIVGMNGMQLACRIYEDTKITYNASDVENFYNKYIKTLRLKINDEGNFYIEKIY